VSGDARARGPSGGVRELLLAATARFDAAGIASPRVDAELLLAFTLGVPRGRLILAPTPTTAETTAFSALVERRAAREPLQYLLGTAAFRHLELAVGPGVFIPRPETELLVDAVLPTLCSADQTVVIDLCAGSGALGLAIAQESPNSRVIAVERSPEALVWLRANVSALAPDGRFSVVAGDVADPTVLDDPAFAGVVGRTAVVVSNPPYVPSVISVAPEVGHDPVEAVFAGADGLGLMPAVFSLAALLLRPGGLVVVEHADSHGPGLIDLVMSSGEWKSVSDHDDLSGRPRFVTAVRSLLA
jgi:release factor glutamine methyltransferase